MVRMTPLQVRGTAAVGITVDLPGTRLVIAATDAGYLMCGALDVALLDARHPERRVVAARAVGVRTLDDLLSAPLERVTAAARDLGIREGMTGEEALGVLGAPATPARAEPVGSARADGGAVAHAR